MTSLFAMGLTRIDCEGGAGLLTSLLEADLVDEVDVSLSPIHSDHGPRLPELQRFTLTSTLNDGPWQFQRWLKQAAV